MKIEEKGTGLPIKGKTATRMKKNLHVRPRKTLQRIKAEACVLD